MRNYKKNWEVNLKLNTFLNIISKPVTLENYHSIQKEIDLYYNTYQDSDSFMELQDYLERECMNIFYNINYN